MNTWFGELQTPTGDSVFLKALAEKTFMADGSAVETHIEALEQMLSGQGKIFGVENIAARDALEDVNIGDQAWVADATADETVTTGGAKYLWLGASGIQGEDGYIAPHWFKLANVEDINAILDWKNIKDKPQVVEDLSDNGNGVLLYRGQPVSVGDSVSVSGQMNHIVLVPKEKQEGVLYPAGENVIEVESFPAILKAGDVLICDSPFSKKYAHAEVFTWGTSINGWIRGSTIYANGTYGSIAACTGDGKVRITAGKEGIIAGDTGSASQHPDVPDVKQSAFIVHLLCGTSDEHLPERIEALEQLINGKESEEDSETGSPGILAQIQDLSARVTVLENISIHVEDYTR